jgi:hypothetical protein
MGNPRAFSRAAPAFATPPTNLSGALERHPAASRGAFKKARFNEDTKKEVTR